MSPSSRLLLLGYRPPPYFGPSVTYEALLKSAFSSRFAVTFLDLTVSRQIADIERFRFGKLAGLARQWCQLLGWLVRHRFELCCLPISANRNAYLKEAAQIWLCHRFGVPVVLYAHGNGFLDFYEHASPRLQKKIARTVSWCAAAIVMGDRLRFNFERWLAADRVFVVGSGIIPAELPARVARPGVTVLYLGNLVRDKGIFVILEAAAQIVAARPDVRFVFAGEWFRPADRAEAEQFIAAHRLTNHVSFTGVVWGPAKARCLAAADILAFPTFYPYEAHPLVVVEGLQAGLPVVTTARGAIPEIIRDGINGLLVQERNAADLTEKLLRLIADPHLRTTIGHANRERFQQHYTHEAYGARMCAVFDAVRARSRDHA